MLHESIKHGTKGDVTRDDSQPRFLAQHSVAMLEQYCNYSKQCCNNVATLCCAKKSLLRIVSCKITLQSRQVKRTPQDSINELLI